LLETNASIILLNSDSYDKASASELRTLVESGERPQEAFSALDKEIDGILTELGLTLESMDSADPASARLVPRYLDILRAGVREHRRIKDTVGQIMQRRELFGEARDNALRPRTEQLLKERSSLHSSIEMTNALIGTARRAHSGLEDTREVLSGTSGRLGKVNSRFPALGEIIGQIQRSRQRDTIVLSLLVGVLMFVTFAYVLLRR
jgi:hypothetical protein